SMRSLVVDEGYCPTISRRFKPGRNVEAGLEPRGVSPFRLVGLLPQSGPAIMLEGTSSEGLQERGPMADTVLERHYRDRVESLRQLASNDAENGGSSRLDFEELVTLCVELGSSGCEL